MIQMLLFGRCNAVNANRYFFCARVAIADKGTAARNAAKSAISDCVVQNRGVTAPLQTAAKFIESGNMLAGPAKEKK
jgi:hypothetical protein